MRHLMLVILFFLVAQPVLAQTKVVDQKFVLTSAALVATTVYDNETSFHALKNCPACYEKNFLLKPFVNKGRVATYTLTMGINTGLIYISYRMKKAGHPLWWIVPAQFSIVHGVAGSFNLRF